MRRAKSLVATACCLSVVFFLTLHEFILIHRPVDDPHGLRYGYMGFPRPPAMPRTVGRMLTPTQFPNPNPNPEP